VRLGNLKTNKSQLLYPGGSLVVSVVSRSATTHLSLALSLSLSLSLSLAHPPHSPDGSAILSGHSDGSIYRFFFEGGGTQVRDWLCACVSACFLSILCPGVRESRVDLSVLPDYSSPCRPSQGIFARHSCAPYCLTWATHVAAAGCDRRIVFYDDQGERSCVWTSTG
jgi:hypothetical protein